MNILFLNECFHYFYILKKEYSTSIPNMNEIPGFLDEKNMWQKQVHCGPKYYVQLQQANFLIII